MIEHFRSSESPLFLPFALLFSLVPKSASSLQVLCSDL